MDRMLEAMKRIEREGLDATRFGLRLPFGYKIVSKGESIDMVMKINENGGIYTYEGTCEPDMVNKPPHYRQGDIECIDAIKSALTEEEFRGYCKGNALKYIWRERYKGHDQDLEKAKWYMARIGYSIASITKQPVESSDIPEGTMPVDVRTVEL